jgi:hypothetical protein
MNAHFRLLTTKMPFKYGQNFLLEKNTSHTHYAYFVSHICSICRGIILMKEIADYLYYSTNLSWYHVVKGRAYCSNSLYRGKIDSNRGEMFGWGKHFVNFSPSAFSCKWSKLVFSCFLYAQSLSDFLKQRKFVAKKVSNGKSYWKQKNI